MTTEERLRSLLEAATPGPWHVDGPEFGGVWVVTGGPVPKDSFAVHPSAAGQPYAVLGGQGDEDAALIVEAVNALPKLLAVVHAGKRVRAARSDRVKAEATAPRAIGEPPPWHLLAEAKAANEALDAALAALEAPDDHER